jgi:hypothetical protein
MTELRIIQLIETSILRRGKGVEGDPVRIVEQYWDMEGNLCFEYDTHTEKFIRYCSPSHR